MLKILKGNRNPTKQAAATAQTTSISGPPLTDLLSEQKTDYGAFHAWAEERKSKVSQLGEKNKTSQTTGTPGAVQPQPEVTPAQPPKVTLAGSAERGANNPSSESVPREPASNEAMFTELELDLNKALRELEHVVEERVMIKVVEQQSEVTTATPFLLTEKNGLELPEEAVEAAETMAASTSAQPQPELAPAQPPKTALAGLNGSLQDLFAHFDTAHNALANGNGTAAQYARAFSQDISGEASAQKSKENYLTMLDSATGKVLKTRASILEQHAKETEENPPEIANKRPPHIALPLMTLDHIVLHIENLRSDKDDDIARDMALSHKNDRGCIDLAIIIIKKLTDSTTVAQKPPVREILKGLLDKLEEEKAKYQQAAKASHQSENDGAGFVA